MCLWFYAVSTLQYNKSEYNFTFVPQETIKKQYDAPFTLENLQASSFPEHMNK